MTCCYGIGPEDFAIGDRVQLAPHLDRWMAGDRYGTIVHVHRGGFVARVDMARSGASLRFNVSDLTLLDTSI